MRPHAKDHKSGFTLIELLAVIAIIALLAVTLLPALAGTTDHAKRAECGNNLRQIAVALVSYTGEYNDFMPALKWADSNEQYPYEMFRYATPGTNPPDYVLGPYNLGVLWNSGILKDGHVFYCPGRADSINDTLTYQFYDQKTNWPSGGDPAHSNPGYVRSGYLYYPQSMTTAVDTGVTFPVFHPIVPIWPDKSTSPEPYRTWFCVPLFKLSNMDLSKSMVTDYFLSGLNNLSHGYGSNPTGMNALFPDGHVNWQSARGNPSTFDPNLMADIAIDTSHGAEVRYVLSTLK